MFGMAASDSVRTRIRRAEAINADGTLGFVPDMVVEPTAASIDLPMQTALKIIAGELTPPPRTSNRAAVVPLRRVENVYPEMKAPNRAYRLLGLFRVWNVMHYFFPYKHLMDRSWDSVLTEYIPRFVDAEEPADYGLAAREFVAHLQDSHVSAHFGATSEWITKSISYSYPLIRVASMKDNIV